MLRGWLFAFSPARSSQGLAWRMSHPLGTGNGTPIAPGGENLKGRRGLRCDLGLLKPDSRGKGALKQRDAGCAGCSEPCTGRALPQSFPTDGWEIPTRGEDWGGSVAVLVGAPVCLGGMPRALGNPDLRGTQGSDATRVYGTVRGRDTPMHGFVVVGLKSLCADTLKRCVGTGFAAPAALSPPLLCSHGGERGWRCRAFARIYALSSITARQQGKTGNDNYPLGSVLLENQAIRQPLQMERAACAA